MWYKEKGWKIIKLILQSNLTQPLSNTSILQFGVQLGTNLLLLNSNYMGSVLLYKLFHFSLEINVGFWFLNFHYAHLSHIDKILEYKPSKLYIRLTW